MSFTRLPAIKFLSVLMLFLNILPLACDLFDSLGPYDRSNHIPAHSHQHNTFGCELCESVYITSSQEFDYTPASTKATLAKIGGLLPGYKVPIYIPPNFVA